MNKNVSKRIIEIYTSTPPPNACAKWGKAALIILLSIYSCDFNTESQTQNSVCKFPDFSIENDNCIQRRQLNYYIYWKKSTNIYVIIKNNSKYWVNKSGMKREELTEKYALQHFGSANIFNLLKLFDLFEIEEINSFGGLKNVYDFHRKKYSVNKDSIIYISCK